MQVLAGHFVLGLMRKKKSIFVIALFGCVPLFDAHCWCYGSLSRECTNGCWFLNSQQPTTKNLWAVSTREAQRTKDKRHRDRRVEGKNDRIKFGRTWLECFVDVDLRQRKQGQNKMLLQQNYFPPLAGHSKMVSILLARRPVIIAISACLVIAFFVLLPSFRLAPLPSPSTYFAGASEPCSIDDTKNNTLGVSALWEQDLHVLIHC